MAETKKLLGTTNEDDDDLLCDLTEEELAELNESLGDEMLPAHAQVKDQTTKKQTTGNFDRNSLMEFLREEAKEEDAAVDPNYVPYVKKTRGKVYQPKEHIETSNTKVKQEKTPLKDLRKKEQESKMTKSSDVTTTSNGEDDELFDGLTEEELAELNEELDDDMLPARMR